MTRVKIETLPPAPGSAKVMLHTLQNGIVRARLYAALFGKPDRPGFLSHLGVNANDLDLVIKMRTALFCLAETFSPKNNRLTSVLRQAAEALRLEIFERPWTEQQLFADQCLETFSWKTTATTIPVFLNHCELVLRRLERPLFGGLPKLAADLIAIAKGPGPDQQQEAVVRFMASLDHTKPVESVVNLLQLLGAEQLIPRKTTEAIIIKFHALKPTRKVPDQAAAILEAKAYVMGVVIHQTRSVSAYAENWFRLLGFGQYHTDEIRDLMLKMGFDSEWRSFDIEFQAINQPAP